MGIPGKDGATGVKRGLALDIARITVEVLLLYIAAIGFLEDHGYDVGWALGPVELMGRWWCRVLVVAVVLAVGYVLWRRRQQLARLLQGARAVATRLLRQCRSGVKGRYARVVEVLARPVRYDVLRLQRASDTRTESPWGAEVRALKKVDAELLYRLLDWHVTYPGDSVRVGAVYVKVWTTQLGLDGVSVLEDACDDLIAADCHGQV